MKISLNSFLSKESQTLNTREKVYFILGVGLFVFLFLVFFQPFGVNNYDPSEAIGRIFLLAMFGMGMVVSLTLAINEFLVYPLVIRRPTLLHNTLWIIWSAVCISTSLFFYYNILGNWHDFRFSSWLEFIGNISALFLLPVIGVILYLHIRGLKQTLHEITLNQDSHDLLVSSGDQIISFIAENEKDKLSLPLRQVVYLESQDNYVAIYHLAHDQLKKTLLRTSIKKIQEANLHNALKRCHRSFMVNLFHIQHLKGHRNAAMLILDHVATPFPVSSQYFEALHTQLT